MPITTPVLSWTQIRNYAERWSWEVPGSKGLRTVGFNVPEAARKTARQVPFHLRAVSKKGELLEGEVICLKVFPNHQRLVKWIASNEIRRICDALIIEIDGVRFVTH